MPSLTFTRRDDATPCAVVRGGKLDGSVLSYAVDDDPRGKFVSDVTLAKYADRLGVKPSERVRIMNRLMDYLREGKDPATLTDEPVAVRAVYEAMKKEAESPSDIKLPVGSSFEIVPNPDPKQREVLRIAGMSGSGKSFLARTYAENYRKLFPDRPVYLISELTHDETLDNMKGGAPLRISLDKLLEDPLKVDEFEPCLIVFDDIDSLKKPYDALIYKMIDDVVSMGRHGNVSCIICAHNLTDFKRSRMQLAESHWLCFFPSAVSPKALRYVCENYAGMDIEDIKRLRRLGRWVCIHKTYPPFVLSQHEAFLLNSSAE